MPSTADIKQRDPQNLTVPSSSQNLRNEYLSQSHIKRDLEIDNKIRDTILGNENRYSQAISMFPALKQYGITPPHVMAVIRVEILNYDNEDKKQDKLAKEGKTDKNTTLGYSQISYKGVQELRKEFPQLDKLLTEQGFANDPHGNQRALVTPLMVPYLAAAKLASITNVYENSPQKGVDITPKTIIYGYNADVYFSSTITSKDELKVGHQWRLVPGVKKVFPGNKVNEWIDDAADASTYVEGVFKELEKTSNPFYLKRQSNVSFATRRVKTVSS
jgi:hypothetical protein